MTNESAFHNKYSLVKGAARRARQLQSGASPLIVAKSMKACRVAQDEIKQGHVKFVLPERAGRAGAGSSTALRAILLRAIP